MKELIEKRLAELQAEYETGQKLSMDLEQKRTALEQTVLRISGAIQVCQELLKQQTESELTTQIDAEIDAALGVTDGDNN